ncbi:VWA domain-containing protein, partial [bacterium]|nr:VWA domain-containing protein [bacterium]
DYYHVGVIGYGATVGTRFVGHLASKELSPISLIANSPTRIEERSKKIDDGAGGLIDQTIKFPIWFDPIADGGTPMCQALGQAKTIIQNWINDHQTCFPPILINITDGEATDGDPTEIANDIRAIASLDGNTLLFNVHVSSQKASPIEFPDHEGGLPDEYARRLFRMSSTLPTHLQNAARQEGYRILEASKGFVFNADIVSVIRFLDIGTRPSNLR